MEGPYISVIFTPCLLRVKDYHRYLDFLAIWEMENELAWNSMPTSKQYIFLLYLFWWHVKCLTCWYLLKLKPINKWKNNMKFCL